MADIFKLKSDAQIPYSSDIAFWPATGMIVYNNISQTYEPAPIDITRIENKFTGSWTDQPT